MAHYCSECAYLEERKSKGIGKYECSHKKSNTDTVWGSMPACYYFTECMIFNRDSTTQRRLYDEGKKIYG